MFHTFLFINSFFTKSEVAVLFFCFVFTLEMQPDKVMRVLKTSFVKKRKHEKALNDER